MDTRKAILKACFAVAVFFYVAAGPLSGPLYAESEPLDLEMQELALFYAEEDLIYSVSKREETYLEAPSAVYTITAEDIKYSGAKKLTDVFRMVPGVDVADVNSFVTGVQARGFSFFPKYARQMLVLIDGRTVYSPQINATFWDQIPVFLENIERIEVIRGPNAALYGANAFNGVINIITYDPEKTKGVLLSVTAGNRESQWETVRYGGSAGNLTYRLTAGYHETRGFSNVHDRIRKPQLTFRGDYAIDDTSTLSLQAGYAGGDRELAEQVDPEVTSYFLMAKYEKRFGTRNTLTVQYYHDYRNSSLSTFKHEDKSREDDLEIQFNRNGDKYNLVCGMGYRVDRERTGFLSGDDYRAFTRKGGRDLNIETKYNHIFKMFVNYTYHLSEKLHLTTALMIEDNDFVGTMYSPKGALVYLPTENHSLRFSVSRAYRTPSFIEEYADMSVPAPFAPGYIGQLGNEHLNPERIVAFEIGYRGKFLDNRLSVNLELFYHDIDDVIIYRDLDEPSVYRYDNHEDNHVRGVEASFTWKVAPWWRLSMAYTYQESSDDYLEGLVIEQKYTMGNRFMLPMGITANIQLYFVDYFHFEQEAWVPESTVKDYTRLDVRVSKTFLDEKLELAVIGQNLLDPRHYEYPLALSAGEANRTIYFEFTYRFGGE